MTSTTQFEDDKINLHEKSGIACDRLRQELKKCIKESDCVQKDRRPAKECIRATDGSVPERCFSLLTTFSDCKRSIVCIFNVFLYLSRLIRVPDSVVEKVIFHKNTNLITSVN